MSLILDALNRSDDERSAPDVPGLQTRHDSPPDAGGLTSERLLLALIAVLVLVLVAVLYLFWGDRSSAPAMTVAAPASASGSTAPPAAAPKTLQPAPVEVQPDPVRNKPAVVTQQALPTQPQVGNQANTQTSLDREVASLYAAAESAQEKASTRQSSQQTPAENESGVAEASAGVKAPEQSAIDVDALAKAAELELRNRPRQPLDDHPVPLISDLNQREKDAIPSVFYSAHRWSSGGLDNSVTLNGSAVRVGSSAGSGLEVEEILEDSVVLNYRGTQFRLRSLNSWVNL